MNTGTEVTGGGPVVVEVGSLGPSVVDVDASVVLASVVVSIDVVAGVVIGSEVTASEEPDDIIEVVEAASLAPSLLDGSLPSP
ncbi:hypothetical protein POL25_36550 [Nannocystis sp. bb15-2]|uniref:Uncharacterized protein n=1 Tax=Nannocystis bainbridge TaxID=2995303 RepID=A0ABT5EAI4_9BACT|nr:hypothetical protein [Nannocystis bainbridge]